MKLLRRKVSSLLVFPVLALVAGTGLAVGHGCRMNSEANTAFQRVEVVVQGIERGQTLSAEVVEEVRQLVEKHGAIRDAGGVALEDKAGVVAGSFALQRLNQLSETERAFLADDPELTADTFQSASFNRVTAMETRLRNRAQHRAAVWRSLRQGNKKYRLAATADSERVAVVESATGTELFTMSETCARRVSVEP